MEAYNKTAFVTGGSGFVGERLIARLIEEGYYVKALARSQKSARKVQSLGAVPVAGDLTNREGIQKGVSNCRSVFHLAASVDFFASTDELRALHVEATRGLLTAAQEEGVCSFVYLGAASVAINGKPLSNVNEDFVSNNLTNGYSQTKLEAEQLVLSRGTSRFKTVSLRPPLIWGEGDPNTLPAILQAIDKGQMMLIDKGEHRFVTCHVANICHALILADNSRVSGKAYFITDLEAPVFREFMRRYVGTQGIQLPNKSVPLWLARGLATLMEGTWRLLSLKGQPPLFNGLVDVLGLEFTVDCSSAKQDLGYYPLVSINEGMRQMMPYGNK